MHERLKTKIKDAVDNPTVQAVQVNYNGMPVEISDLVVNNTPLKVVELATTYDCKAGTLEKDSASCNTLTFVVVDYNSDG